MIKSYQNHSPGVSVIMPVYNGARTLMESVDSVLQQTYHDLELIICDDASTDETGDILNKIRDDRVHVIYNLNNLGQGLSKDRAINLARSIWIAVIDADDTWMPNRLETFLNLADGNEDNIIFDDIMECHDTSSGMIPWRVIHGKYAFDGNGIEAAKVVIDKFLISERLLIKPLLPLSYIKQYNVHHSGRKFGEDAEFFIMLLSHGLQLLYIPKAMYYYRITPGSMTGSTERSGMMREVLENSINLFNHAPAVQAALRKKIVMVTRDERYLPVIWALKKNEFVKALRLVCQSPWIVAEFFRRLGHSLAYQVHRIWHGGRSRGLQ
jgi:glycosyltransferase involved in cell wall biosynthesis